MSQYPQQPEPLPKLCNGCYKPTRHHIKGLCVSCWEDHMRRQAEADDDD